MQLGIVSATVDVSVFVEVDEIYQRLFTYSTDKTGGVPWICGADTGGEYSDVTPFYYSVTLQ